MQKLVVELPNEAWDLISAWSLTTGVEKSELIRRALVLYATVQDHDGALFITEKNGNAIEKIITLPSLVKPTSN